MRSKNVINFLQELLEKSNNKEEVVKLKLVEIENRPNFKIINELLDKTFTYVPFENRYAKREETYTILKLNGDGTIEFIPSIISLYLETLK